MDTSPFIATRALDVQMNGMLRHVDLHALAPTEQKTVASLQRELADARLDVRDYELSETRAEQLQNAQEATRRLEHIRKLILQASEFGIFGAVDVAQLTAQVEQIISQLL